MQNLKKALKICKDQLADMKDRNVDWQKPKVRLKCDSLFFRSFLFSSRLLQQSVSNDSPFIYSFAFCSPSLLGPLLSQKVIAMLEGNIYQKLCDVQDDDLEVEKCHRKAVNAFAAAREYIESRLTKRRKTI